MEIVEVVVSVAVAGEDMEVMKIVEITVGVDAQMIEVVVEDTVEQEGVKQALDLFNNAKEIGYVQIAQTKTSHGVMNVIDVKLRREMVTEVVQVEIAVDHNVVVADTVTVMEDHAEEVSAGEEEIGEEP